MVKTAYTLKLLITAIFFLFSVFVLKYTYPVLQKAFDQTTRASGDTTAPTSTLSINPSSPDGQNGWYVNPVDVTIAADDLESGVQSINWTLDGTSDSQTFSNTLNLAPNPSFEDAGLPVNMWDKVNDDGGASYTQDPSAAPSLGASSVSIVSTTSDWHGINHKNNFSVASNLQNMTSSLWIRTENVTGSAQYKVYLVYDDGVGNSGTSLLATSASVTGTQPWQKISLNFIPNNANTVGIYIEAGLTGTGSVWFDGANISSSITTTQTNFAVSASGNHSLSYHSADFSGNVETPRNTTFKIDTKAPSKWVNFSLTQSGNTHTFIVSIRASDAISGIDVSTAQFQYSVDEGATWGYYSTLTGCNTTFNSGWANASTSPNSDGSTTVTVSTPAIDFCNSNWATSKKIRFRVSDMAGNLSQSSDFTINGAWVQVGSGEIGSNFDIGMQTGSQTAHLVTSKGSLSGITSSSGWYLEDYDHTLPFQTYSTWYSKYPTTTSLPSGRLPTASGRYRVNSDFTIASSTLPSNLSTRQNISAVIFINGDLNVNTNYSLHATTGYIFIVNGDVTVGNSVSSVDGYFISDGEFDVGSGSTALTITGGVQADSFNLKRSLSGNQNTSNPAETFNFHTKYFITGRNQLTDNYSVTWLSSN